MSDVFEGYERQYSELSANLTKKCTTAGGLHGGRSNFRFLLIQWYLIVLITLLLWINFQSFC